jgi:iron complex transport system permease protein
MRTRAVLWAVGGLIAAILIGLAHGPVPIPLGVIANRLLHPGSDVDSLILWQIRLPRVLAAALVGGGLAVAGAVMQALLRNPLADPYVVGASSGAGLGAILTQILLGTLVPFGAFLGALAAVLISFFLARSRGTLQVLTLILAGYAVSVMLSAISVFLMLMNQQSLTVIFAWEVGGLHGESWGPVGIAAGLILGAAALAWLTAPTMNALLLGEEQAEYLGVRVEAVQVALLLWASLLTAAAVYLAGLIGFVGLVVPHVLRRRVGPDHRLLLPLALLWGAAFLVVADTFAESLPVLGTVPVGLVTAFLGGPYFLWILVRTQREGVIF